MSQQIKLCFTENTELKKQYDTLQNEINNFKKSEASGLNTEERNKKIEELQKKLGEFKKESNNELKAVVGDVELLKEQYQKETEQIAQNYQNSLNQASYAIQVEKEKSEQLQAEVEKVSRELEVSKEEHKSEILEIESKMKQLSFSLVEDSDKIKKLRVEKNEEVNRLNKKLREISSELTLKTEVIEELTKEKEAQRNLLKELKINYEIQGLHKDMKDAEYDKALISKKSEIQNMMTKSYHPTGIPTEQIKQMGMSQNTGAIRRHKYHHQISENAEKPDSEGK